MTRNVYDEALSRLKQLVLDMGQRVEMAIDQSIRALANRDKALAERVIARDPEIDRLQWDVEKAVSMLIATQQPVARDLRRILSTLLIASDLERMGDLALNIALVAKEFVEENLVLFKPLEDLSRLAQQVQEMVHLCINSCIDENPAFAYRVGEMDDAVDVAYRGLVEELIGFLASEGQYIKERTRLAFVCRYLERIADHATNIAERVVYIVEGKVPDLN
ncbi:MAG TPA: phosphate signaling complex protein PhoU [Calditerricola sp.]